LICISLVILHLNKFGVWSLEFEVFYFMLQTASSYFI